jgi:AcrR family transcriptional regulator
MQCALVVILERGYHGATLTEIARRAGVGTPAIYRRWPTKSELAMDIIVHVSEPEPIPDSDSIGEDLVSFMALRLRTWTTPLFRQLVLPVLLEGHSDGALAVQIRERFVEYRRGLAARIRRSIDSGELVAGTDPDRLIDLLMGTVAMPLLFFQDVPTIDQARSIVDQILSGYAARDPAVGSVT